MQMNYLETIAWKVEDKAFQYGEEVDPNLATFYALLVLLGKIEPENVHDAWSAWTYLFKNPHHRSLVPFSELPVAVQKLDDPFSEILKEVVAELNWPMPTLETNGAIKESG